MGRKETKKGSRGPVANNSKVVPFVIEAGDKPKVGALAWCQTGETYDCTSRDLIETLQPLRNGSAIAANLILCSGIKVRPEGNRAEDRRDPPSALGQSIAKAAGCPVLFEMRTASGKHRWLLASSSGIQEIRRDQYVVGSGPSKFAVGQVLQELTNGYGHITLKSPDRTVELVLLICGEARIFAASSKACQLRHRWDAAEIPGPLLGDWVMLHPSHNPYTSTSKHSGFGIVGPWTQKGSDKRPALLQQITNLRAQTGDARLPKQVVHAGAWKDNERERPFGVRGYKGGKTLNEVASQEIGGHKVLYAEFEV